MVRQLNEEQRSLVENNLKLVTYCVTKYVHPPYNEIDDYLQEGNYGLCLAALGFDPTKGYQFATYASSMIVGTCFRYRRDNQMIKYPRKTRDQLYKVIRKAHEDNVDITPELIREVCDTVEQEIAVASMCNGVTGMESPFIQSSRDEGVLTIADVIADSYDPTEIMIIDNVLDSALDYIRSRISQKDSDMFEEHLYMRIAGDNISQRALGEKYGVSQAQASRALKRAYALLEDYMNSE